MGFVTLSFSVPKDVLAGDAKPAEKLEADKTKASGQVSPSSTKPKGTARTDRTSRAGEGASNVAGKGSRQTQEDRESVRKGPDDALRFDINVWYPTNSRRRRLLDYQGWTFRAAVRADVRDGRHPLILFSHSSSGNRFTHHEAARELTARGFVVAALTHPFDNLDAMRSPYSMASLERRARDLSVTLDLLLADSTFGPHIDTARVGVTGFGSGAAAALLLGGALPDCSLWKNFCQKQDGHDPYCNAWARDSIEKNICSKLPMKASLADTRIKAVAAVEPAFSILFSARALGHCRPRTLLVFGDRDDHESVAKERILLPERFGPGVETRYVNRGSLEAFMSPCPDSLARELPELCLGVALETRAFARDRLVRHLADFFTRSLVNATPRPCPIQPPPKNLRSLRKGPENSL